MLAKSEFCYFALNSKGLLDKTTINFNRVINFTVQETTFYEPVTLNFFNTIFEIFVDFLKCPLLKPPYLTSDLADAGY